MGFIFVLLTSRVMADTVNDAFAYYRNHDYARAAAILGPAAQTGDARAETLLAIMYRNGSGLAKNYEKAAQLYQLAAAQGVATAQYDLAQMYLNGEGVSMDLQKAANWFQKAAEQGSTPAQFNLGLMYEGGKVIGQNMDKAIYWYRKAADKIPTTGEAAPNPVEEFSEASAYSLGMIYKYGRGVSEDLSKARYWFDMAAKKKLAPAEYQLGLLKEAGILNEKPDLQQSLVWYQKAAEHGSLLARTQLTAFKSGAQSSCDNDEINQLENNALSDFPLKPGSWKVQISMVSNHITSNSAEKKTCQAEKMVCVIASTNLAPEKYWNKFKIQNIPPVGAVIFNETSTDKLAEISYQSVEPLWSIRATRTKISEDHYQYKLRYQTDSPWKPEGSNSGDLRVFKDANFIGACKKN